MFFFEIRQELKALFEIFPILKDHVCIYILARVILEFGDMDSGGGCGDDGAY